jgi:hypothetical protein
VALCARQTTQSSPFLPLRSRGFLDASFAPTLTERDRVWVFLHSGLILLLGKYVVKENKRVLQEVDVRCWVGIRHDGTARTASLQVHFGVT